MKRFCRISCCSLFYMQLSETDGQADSSGSEQCLQTIITLNAPTTKKLSRRAVDRSPLCHWPRSRMHPPVALVEGHSASLSSAASRLHGDAIDSKQCCGTRSGAVRISAAVEEGTRNPQYLLMQCDPWFPRSGCIACSHCSRSSPAYNTHIYTNAPLLIEHGYRVPLPHNATRHGHHPHWDSRASVG